MATNPCVIPGCNRSFRAWRRNGSKGRKPTTFKVCAQDKVKKWYRWESLLRDILEKPLSIITVCDIHFIATDFFTTYSKKINETTPEHLRCVKLKQEASPTLFLDKAENLRLHEKAQVLGIQDWWRLSDTYDETLDLDQLIKYNKPVSYKVMPWTAATLAPGKPNVNNYNKRKPDNSVESVNNQTNKKQKSASVVESVSSDTLSARELYEALQNSSSVCLLTPDQLKTEVSTYFPDISQRGVKRLQNISKEVSLPSVEEVKTEEDCEQVRAEELKKKLHLFRTLCTSPLSLPKHWAVHAYIEDNFMIISKDVFSKVQGFVVERALRVTSDMKCSDVHVRGSDVTQLMQDQPLSCLADLEQLVEQVDTW